MFLYEQKFKIQECTFNFPRIIATFYCMAILHAQLKHYNMSTNNMKDDIHVVHIGGVDLELSERRD